jgi:hypothetical protein
MLNANVQDEVNAKEGQGMNRTRINPRNLNSKNVSTPDKISMSVRENPALYSQIISPADVQITRVINQVKVSENSSVPISTMLNNKLNPTMDNMSIKGGDRKSI